MNELDIIESLAKQAMDYAAEQYGPQRQGEKVWDPYTYDRKFAELIVRECAEVAHCNFHVDGLTLGDILKKHFGISDDL